MADLDRRLGAEVDRSAAVVAAGRQNLDAVKQWVQDTAASVPAGSDRDQFLTQIARRGIGDVADVVRQSNSDLNIIGDRIRTIGNEYRTLGGPKKEGGPGDNVPEDGGPKTPPKRTDMSSGDINAVDAANRKLLDDMEREYSKLPPGQVRTDRLADIAGIREALKVRDSHLVYLEKPADPSQMIPAATSVGDPFKADHVSVTVPGVGGTTRGTIAGMTGEAAELRNEAIDVAQRVGASTNVATVAWVGYQPPANLGQMSVLSDDLAQAGAPKLTSFLSDLDAASTNPGHTTALFGHSYGSLTSGIALGEGASKYVDNAVLYGSPGFEATSPAKLGMNDNNFFVMSAFDDPINPIGALAPYHGFGADPNDIINDDGHLRFRFQHLSAQAGDTPIPGYEPRTGASGHSEYGRNAQERMTGYNLATILLNRPDLAVTETPATWR